jgi:hypothetical protein
MFGRKRKETTSPEEARMMMSYFRWGRLTSLSGMPRGTRLFREQERISRRRRRKQ